MISKHAESLLSNDEVFLFQPGKSLLQTDAEIEGGRFALYYLKNRSDSSAPCLIKFNKIILDVIIIRLLAAPYMTDCFQIGRFV